MSVCVAAKSRPRFPVAKGVSFLLVAIALFFAVKIPLAAQSSVDVSPGQDIGASVNAAIGSLPGHSGTVRLPAGTLVQSAPIKISGNGIHLVGATTGTTLRHNPAMYHVLDSADSAEGWRGAGVSLGTLSSFGEDHPDPMEGSGYLSATTGASSARIAKTIPPTDFRTLNKIGIWFTLNLTNEQNPIEFFVSDGSNTAYWNLTAASIYATWKFTGLDRASPTGSDGGLPDMGHITEIGFRKLLPHAKYYFDAISLYSPIGQSIEFSSCAQCSLENVNVQWEPAADTDSAVLADQNTSQLAIRNVHVSGGVDAIGFAGSSSGNTCEGCTVEYAQNGIALRGNSHGNRLIGTHASRNVVGIYVGDSASSNELSGARCVRNDGAGIFIDGSNNRISDSYIETWMTFGLVVEGAHNTIAGVTAKSSVGESAVQLIRGAADNTLSNINILQSGGSGLDLGGGVKPQIHNTATDIIVRGSGSSSWHGGPKASQEGRGLCLCNANENTITRLQIYDSAQKSTVPGAEGIIINNGSSGNILEDVAIYNSRHEGITLWDASDNTLRNVRLVGNGMHQGGGAGIRIDAGTKNTVIENVCFWMNGGGGIKNLSQSSVIRNAKQVQNLDVKSPCQ